MWIVLIAAVLIVAGAVIVVLRRPRGNDLSSVRKYHSALGTIEQLAERNGRAAVGVVGSPDGSGDQAVDGPNPAPGVRGPGDVGRAGESGTGGHVRTAAGTGRWVPPVPVRDNDEFPDPDSSLVFEDSHLQDRVGRGHPSEGVPLHRTDRAQKHALESMNRRPRRGTAVMTAVIIVALFGALAYVGSRHSNSAGHGHSAAASSVSSTSSSVSSDPSSTSSTVSGHARKSGRTKRQSRNVKSPPVTVPSRIVALSSTAASAVYPVGTGSYTIKVSATAPCWVLATATSKGSTLWTGTVQAGGSQVIAATGVTTVELGAPSGSLAVDNVPVTFPTPAHTPFVATFQPTATTSTPPTATAPGGVPVTTAG